jgi:hypothetical protein
VTKNDSESVIIEEIMCSDYGEHKLHSEKYLLWLLQIVV